MKLSIPVLALLLTHAVSAYTIVYPYTTSCSGTQNSCETGKCCTFQTGFTTAWLNSAFTTVGDVYVYQYSDCTSHVANTDACLGRTSYSTSFSSANPYELDPINCGQRPYNCTRKKRSMKLTRNLVKDVLGVEKMPEGTGWKDAVTGVHYMIPSNVPEAITFRNLPTEEEREAFAKENFHFTVTFDESGKNIKSVQKSSLWKTPSKR